MQGREARLVLRLRFEIGQRLLFWAARRLDDAQVARRGVCVPKTRFSCKSAHSRKAIRVLALATSGLRQTEALIEACSSDSSAA
jgi:hypothetical protein